MTTQMANCILNHLLRSVPEQHTGLGEVTVLLNAGVAVVGIHGELFEAEEKIGGDESVIAYRGTLF